MKTSYALSFSLLLALGTSGLVAFAGCSSSSTTPAAPADTGVVDTGTVKVDTGTDTNPAVPVTCAADLGSDFACVPPTAVVAAKLSCSEAAIQDFTTACLGSGTATACSAWQKANTACNTCVFKYIDQATGSLKPALCYKSLDTTGTCGTSVECYNDCLADVCGSCDTTTGSGSTATRSEMQDCERDAVFAGNAAKPKGRCYDATVKNYNTCTADSRFANCGDWVSFLRGGCRDGVDWTHADDPNYNLPADAGTDASSDATSDAAADATADAAADAADSAADAVADGG